MPIIRDQEQTISLTLRSGGTPITIDPTASVTVQLFTSNGTTAISGVVPVDPYATGANWANGIVVVDLTAQDTINVTPPSVVFLVTAIINGRTKTWSASVQSIDGAPVVMSALSDKTTAVGKLRSALMLGVASKLNIDPSLIIDDELWDYWLASEADAGRRLAVPLQPTQIFDHQPTSDEINALSGMPYMVEPGYDMPPDFFGSQSWGAIKLRHCPAIQVQRIRLVYPSMDQEMFEIPLSWVKLDNKYGMMHIIPGPNQNTMPLSVFMMQAISAGVQIPHVLRVTYQAGINGQSPEFYDLADLIKQLALLRIMQNAFAPMSGSISADGLSQSYSMDIIKFQDDIDKRLSVIRERLIGPIWGVL